MHHNVHFKSYVHANVSAMNASVHFLFLESTCKPVDEALKYMTD